MSNEMVGLLIKCSIYGTAIGWAFYQTGREFKIPFRKRALWGLLCGPVAWILIIWDGAAILLHKSDNEQEE